MMKLTMVSTTIVQCYRKTHEIVKYFCSPKM